MREMFAPLTVIPGVRRRVDPETHMAMSDKRGNPLWDMPPPVRYADHVRPVGKKRRNGQRVTQLAKVPIYRGTSAAYARSVKSQIRRNQRKAAEEQAAIDARASVTKMYAEADEAALQDLVLNETEKDGFDA